MKFFALLFGLLLAGPAAADGQAVARAFMKIDARTETGVSYKDFSALVGDANLELKLYEASADGKAHPEAVRLFRSALLQYVVSNEMWGMMFSGGRYSVRQITANSDLGRSIGEQFPDARKEYKNGGAMIGNDYQIEFLLPFYWRVAREKAQEAAGKM